MVSRKLFLFFLCLPAIFSSCTGRFVDINRPGSKLSPDELKRDNYAVGSFLIQMQGVAFPEQENAYQTMIDFVGNYLGRTQPTRRNCRRTIHSLMPVMRGVRGLPLTLHLLYQPLTRLLN